MFVASQQNFVIATGQQFSLRQFIDWSAKELGIMLEFVGSDVDKRAVVRRVDGNKARAVSVGDVRLQIDHRLLRRTEVETSTDDPSKAKNKLGRSQPSRCALRWLRKTWPRPPRRP